MILWAFLIVFSWCALLLVVLLLRSRPGPPEKARETSQEAGVRKFQFPSGHWWEVYSIVTFSTYRAVSGLVKKHFELKGDEVTLDWEAVDWDAVDEVLMLHATKAWSYGPLDITTMATIPSAEAREVLDFLNVQYAGDINPLGQKNNGNGLGRPFSPASHGAAPFRPKWKTLFSWISPAGRRKS